MHRARWTAPVAALLGAVMFVAAACGGDGGEEAQTQMQTAAQQATVAETGETTMGAEVALPPDPNAAQFEGADRGSGKGLKIGYISLGESIPFVRLVSNSIKRQARIAGARLIFCDSQIDAAKAIDCAKNFKTQRVDGILNFQAFADAAPEICRAGPDVPVIAIDIHQKPCETAFMGANNERAGEIAGRAMGGYFKEQFDCEYDAVLSLESPQVGEVNTQRTGGYLKGFEAVCGKIENLKRLGIGGTIEAARKQVTDALTALPGAERIVVMSLNDDMALGAIAAARSAGRKDDLYIAGQGADPTSWCRIKNDERWVADSAYFPERYGEILIPNIVRAIKGEKIQKLLYVPHTAITAETIDDHYELDKC